MSTVRVGFFIAISITVSLTSVTYCHPNESGINRHQSQKLSRLLKRETLVDVHHSLEDFENDEESLPDNSQTPLKRSIFTKDSLKPNFNCKSESTEKQKREDKKSKPEKTSEGANASTDSGSKIDESAIVRLDASEQTNPNRSCLPDIFKDTEKFFESVNAELESLSAELSKMFKTLENKTSNLIFSTKNINTELLDMNKCKLAKNSNISSFISELKQNWTKIIPMSTPFSPALASLRSSDITTNISAFIENIRNNITNFIEQMRKKITGDNIFSNFLNQIRDAVNPIKNYNFTILDEITKKMTKNNGTRNQTSIEVLIRQNAALGILGQFLNTFFRGISGFFQVISKKWSQEDRHQHHHGLVGSIKNVLGWPSHTHQEPNWFHKMFSFPNLNWRHQDENVPLLKKILKIPNHHHHHPGSIIKHLLNSLYSVFHLSDHCECPQGSNSATSCPVNNFFNWLGGKPTPSHHHHHKHAPGHINLHRNVMNEQPGSY